MGCSRGTVGEYLSSTALPGLAGSMGRSDDSSASFSTKPHSGDEEEMMVSGVSLGRDGQVDNNNINNNDNNNNNNINNNE